MKKKEKFWKRKIFYEGEEGKYLEKGKKLRRRKTKKKREEEIDLGENRAGVGKIIFLEKKKNEKRKYLEKERKL